MNLFSIQLKRKMQAVSPTVCQLDQYACAQTDRAAIQRAINPTWINPIMLATEPLT